MTDIVERLIAKEKAAPAGSLYGLARMEIERLQKDNKQMIFALEDARLQISYMQEKFKKTGSGENCLSKISNILDGCSLLDNSQPEQQNK